MRILLPLLVLATASFARPTTGCAQARSDTLPIAERRRIVREIDAFTREHFAHWSALGTQSYDSMVAALRTQAEQHADRREFDDAVLAFTAGLRNGHTRFTDAWRARTDGQTLWLWLWPTSEGWTVTGSEILGLTRGAVITHIDEIPIDSAYARARPRIIDSNERMRRYGWTLADYLWPRRFTVTLSDGRRVAVTRGEPSDSAVRAQRAGQPPVAHRWIVKDSIAYVRVPRFSPALYEDSAVAIIRREYLNAPALIVDVRGNGGGNTPRRLIGLLQGNRGGRSLDVEKSTLSSDRLGFLAGLRSSGADDRFVGGLVILADHRCGSACEDFVAPFTDTPHALVVGDTTWGSTGQPKFLDLKNGMQFQVSARRYRRANGLPFEGAGLPPHIVVPLTASDLRAGKDATLERALAEIRAGRAPRAPR